MDGSDELGGVELQMTTQLGRAGPAGPCRPIGRRQRVHRDVQAEKRPLALMSVHMQPTRACADGFTLAYVVQEHRRSWCAENILFTP